ncbi:hypothetical protein E3P92_03929 [Wallemia ichthyophaga]|uniref:DNA helicase n=2 Tax=Wallemia ichthyophaga TaxID=245174 RepID=A0A4T0G1S5_WALIC|nr:uncharacterized protein J056_002908 [Wallemia ichthyophaga EXF-994]TIA68671.1 hypothetical protein E3P91_03972 [Wallemia ichthyophaga]EOR03739.1 hypothetical protein J056_002908 [Wallemia ichthyophaga EXF-994]TIA78238.1 hypothetical protein E3P98_03919 [Wallemia ichthyophaga]TIA89207.1 hypothetical protein E3P97_03179 [Wallemia ichthyophaga]TIA95001.1 hypothetical protein E3P95_03943 [Wallemia ichthyophaga]
MNFNNYNPFGFPTYFDPNQPQVPQQPDQQNYDYMTNSFPIFNPNLMQPPPQQPLNLMPNPSFYRPVVEESMAQRFVRTLGFRPDQLPLVERVLADCNQDYRTATDTLLSLNALQQQQAQQQAQQQQFQQQRHIQPLPPQVIQRQQPQFIRQPQMPPQPLRFRQMTTLPTQSKIRENNMTSVKRQSKKQYNSSDDEGDFGGDSDSDDDNGVRESTVSVYDESEAVKWFNKAEPKEIQEILALSERALEAIMSMRPFQNANTLRAKLKATKGVSTTIFDFYLDLIASYKQVDQVLDKCEQVGGRISSIFSQMEKNDETPPALIESSIKLKSYQFEGVRWLEHLHKQKVSGILADEMGLGKTLQVIVFIAALKNTQQPGPNLIVVPSSTLENWLREFSRFAPSLVVKSYYGDQHERSILRDDLLPSRNDMDVLITTYNLAQGSPQDRKFLRKMKFRTAVFDEGHMLKNRETKSYKYLAELKVPWRLLLTGTPLQNNLQELVSLLNFILPEYFQDTEEALRVVFKVKPGVHASMLSRERVSRAKKMMQPFVLRRKKAQVLTDLPSKRELITYCDLTDSQRNIYTETMSRSRKAIVETDKTEASTPSESGTESTRGRKRGKAGSSKGKDPSESSNHVLMDLRKAANHPLLFRRHFNTSIVREMAKDCLKEPDFKESVYELVVEDMEIMTDSELQNFSKNFQTVNKYTLPESVYMDSGKITALMKILKESRERGDRVLVFSQFTMMLEILKKVLDQHTIRYLMFTGQTQVEERQILVDEFFENTDIQVFLLSTKAGGLGINLTAANVVVIFDSDWNPHADRQAGDRAFRIGQTKDVTIHKFVSKGTIEEDMLRLAETKLKLDKAVGGGEGEYGVGAEEEGNAESTEKVVKSSLLQSIRNRLDQGGQPEEGADPAASQSEFIKQLEVNNQLPEGVQAKALASGLPKNAQIQLQNDASTPVHEEAKAINQAQQQHVHHLNEQKAEIKLEPSQVPTLPTPSAENVPALLAQPLQQPQSNPSADIKPESREAVTGVQSPTPVQDQPSLEIEPSEESQTAAGDQPAQIPAPQPVEASAPTQSQTQPQLQQTQPTSSPQPQSTPPQQPQSQEESPKEDYQPS